MGFKPMSKEAEERLMTALDDVHDLVADGQHPTEAIAKAAADHGIPPGHVKHMAYAYNAARSEQQRQAEDPAASFPLADPAAALERIYPSQLKTAATEQRATEVSDEYSRPPRWLAEQRHQARLAAIPEEKRAAVTVDRRDGEAATYQACARGRDLLREVEEHRRHLGGCRGRLEAGLDKLAAYFEQPGGVPFGEARANVALLYGGVGEALMKNLAARSRYFHKQATYTPVPAFADHEPYATIETCFRAADACLAARTTHAKAAAELPGRIEALFAGLERSDRPAQPGDVLGAVKQAGMGGAIFGTTLAREMANKLPPAQTEDQRLSRASRNLMDPGHDAELRNIRVQATLSDLMANDPEISGHDPDEVIRHANELMQVAPHAADQSAVMRALLRKSLAAGAMDPYDLDTLVKMETGLKTRDSRPKGILDGLGSGQPA